MGQTDKVVQVILIIMTIVTPVMEAWNPDYLNPLQICQIITMHLLPTNKADQSPAVDTITVQRLGSRITANLHNLP